jgi:hypothetical protein
VPDYTVVGAGVITTDGVGVLTLGPQPGANGFLYPTQPNIVDFLLFLATEVQIPETALPPTSVWPQYALNQAIAVVMNANCTPGIIYTLAVYNYATHCLISVTPDTKPLNYFQNLRGKEGYGLIKPITGLVAASSDESTSSTLNSPDWAKKMTVSQLDLMRTPWGRFYLNYAQSAGPNVVGLS